MKRIEEEKLLREAAKREAEERLYSMNVIVGGAMENEWVFLDIGAF